jgi:hypothetical protein
MSSDPLEKNLGDLIRHGALPLDDERRARARQKFLDGTAAPPERASWKIAAAAAAMLVLTTIIWSARFPSRVVLKSSVEEPPSGYISFLSNGGDKNLMGLFGRVEDRCRFQAQSPLPDGLEFTIRAERLEVQEEDRILKNGVRSSLLGSATLRNGGFEFEWPHKGPGRVRLLVSAKDALQNVDLTKKLRELNVSESARQWTFETCAWDEKLLAQLSPQLKGVIELAADVRDLLDRVVQASDFKDAIETQKKVFVREAEKLQARADGLAASGLFPEAARRIGYTARDLAQAIPIFTWKDGKFDGPRSYYTNGEKSKTHRNEPFEFAALFGYLKEAELVADREFGLWVFEEFRRAGPRAVLAETVRPEERRPGLAEVAGRLKQLVHELHGVDTATLERDLRRLP